MSSNGVVMTPLEQHRSLLNSIFKFKPNSKLHSFVTQKSGINKSLFTLAEVLTVLKHAIRGEGLYDEKNPSVILCSQELEEALNMKALHVTEIRDLVLSHLIKLESDDFLKKHCDNVTPAPSANDTSTRQHPVSATQHLIQSANISTRVINDKRAKFTCKPKFLAVLRTMPETDKHKLVFTYEEATLLLSTYILKHKARFFDNRNIKLAMVKGDLLGEAFGVSAFHRCQVNNFLRDQLIPYEPDTCLNTAVKARDNSPGPRTSKLEQEACGTGVLNETNASANLAGSMTGVGNDTTPELENPRTRGVARRRSDTECEEEPRNKQAKTHDTGHYMTVQEGSLSDCETETIYRSQSRDTVSTGSEYSDEEEGDEFGDTAEYEPESCEEPERPPQAMGRQAMNSHTSDSDSEINVDFKVMDKVIKEVELKRESVYWGDDSGVETELDSNSLRLGLTSPWTCVTCREPTRSYFRYCASCWDVRRNWMAQHDGKRKKRREPRGMNMAITPPGGSNTVDDSIASDCEGEQRVSSVDSAVGSSESREQVKATARDTMPALETLNDLATSPSNSAFSFTLGIDRTSLTTSPLTPQETGRQGIHLDSAASQLCLLCCHRTKNASLVHGRIGHQVCCYPCAKRLWRKRADCPVCRRKVERVIKIIPA